MPCEKIKTLFEKFKVYPSEKAFEELKNELGSVDFSEIDECLESVSEANQIVFSDIPTEVLEKTSQFLDIKSIDDYVKISNYELFSSLVNDIIKQMNNVPNWITYNHIKAMVPKKVAELEKKFIEIKSFDKNVQEKIMNLLIQNNLLKDAIYLAHTFRIDPKIIEKSISEYVKNDQFARKLVHPDEEVKYVSNILHRYLEIYHFWRIAYASNTQIFAEKSSEEYLSEIQKISFEISTFYEKIGRPPKKILSSAGQPYENIAIFFDTKDFLIKIIEDEIKKKKHTIEKLRKYCGDVDKVNKLIDDYRKTYLNDVDFQEVLEVYNDCV